LIQITVPASKRGEDNNHLAEVMIALGMMPLIPAKHFRSVVETALESRLEVTSGRAGTS
jgi:hypothetical protein